MASIIAYGTVVRSPVVLGWHTSPEEQSVALSVVVDEDFPDEDGLCQKRGFYRVVVGGEQARFAIAHLKAGSPVLIKGELFEHYPPSGDGQWNHRVVFGDEVLLLSGELAAGRAYMIPAMESIEQKLCVGYSD
jgi:single-stranded DNA-binding protein